MPSFEREHWTRISRYLDEALELTVTERGEYVARLERQDPALAAEVRGILSGHASPEFSGFLSTPLEPAALLADGTSLVGQRVGPYLIEEEIGRGGMGSVWRAQRADGQYEGQVAIKVLNAALVGKPAEQRFRREGSVLAQLRHPHIAQIFDAGIAPSGQAYLVLEYVEGTRIDEYCETRGLPVRERIRLFLDVLAAVAHAHSRLVVHRDIKPTNILVTSQGSAKLLDFGIAALLGAGGEDVGGKTLEAHGAFTPDYAAPEQILNQSVTTATDVYALGLMLFVLLAGRHPRAEAGRSTVERIRAVIESDAPLLSASVADENLGRTLRGDLDNIVAKALRREPAERYVTVEALADDLRRYLANEPVKARPDSLGYRASKFLARHRGAAVTATLTVLGLIGLSVFAWLQMNAARAQRDEALAQKRRADAEASFVTLMLDSMGESGKPLTMTDLLDRGLVLLDREFADDAPFRVHMLINMSGRFMDAGQTAREAAALRKAEDVARKTGDPALLAEVECDSVETEISEGRLEDAAARLKEGQAALTRRDAPLGVKVECMHAEGSLAEAHGDLNRAQQLVAQSVRSLEDAGPERTQGVQYSGLLSHLSVLYMRQGEDRAALDTGLKELHVLEQLGRAGTLHALATRNNVARSLNNLGETRSAVDVMRVLVRPDQASDTSMVLHPAFSASYGELLSRMGENDAALAWFDRAVADADRTGTAGLQILFRLRRARALVQAGCVPQAAEDLNEIERRVRGHEADFAASVQMFPVARAEYLLASGDVSAARATIAPLLTGESVNSPAAAGVLRLRALMVAARIALADHRPRDADRFADEALALARRRARRPDGSADVGEAYLLKAEALRAEGVSTESRSMAGLAHTALSQGLGPAHALTLESASLASAVPHAAESESRALSASRCRAPGA